MMDGTAGRVRARTILVAALGGEGGGVLCEWLVEAARRAGYPVSGTSIPGVAQRTGATTYYVEIFPLRHEALAGRRPVLGLAPVPGLVDLVVATDLVECARLAAAGLIDPVRTRVIAQSERTLTTLEKMAMGDGRLDSAALEAAIRGQARQFQLIPAKTLAGEARTAVSAVLFGAIAGSGIVPLTAAQCEEVIEGDDRAAQASRAGFVLGANALRSGIAAAARTSTTSAQRRAALSESELDLARCLPDAVRAIADTGIARLSDYQGRSYVELYIKRVVSVLAVERRLDPLASREYRLTRECARFLALWMCYEDVPRVADLKSRRSRFERIRAEVKAPDSATVRVTDFFKPRIDELRSLLPARWRGNSVRSLRPGSGRALALKSDSLSGLIALRLLAGLSALRPYSSRYAEEQHRIERWLHAIETAAAHGWSPAYELALCGRLIKGYGETNERAHANLARILETFEDAGRSDALAAAGELAGEIARARDNALAEPSGQVLDVQLARHGIAARPVAVKPLVFVRPGQRVS